MGRERAMAWVFLEIVMAIAVAIFIVWWTLPKKPRKDDDAPPPSA